MPLVELLALGALVLSAISTFLCLVILFGRGRGGPGLTLALEAGFARLENSIRRSEGVTREELGRDRGEAAANARSLREEVIGTFDRLSEAVRLSMSDLRGAQQARLDDFERSLASGRLAADAAAKALREEVQGTLARLGEGIGEKVTALSSRTEERQEALRQTVETRLDVLRTENAAKLDQMRQTVDEKLQGTLEQRLGASFKLVSDQLEQVFRSVGEMQSLATGVGDLKRVLTNVKSRGTWGEVALGGLLEQVMVEDQFERNVEVVPASGQRVEYAIRLPGGTNGDGGAVWLPIDAKFPTEDYERLVEASERGDPEGVETAAKAMEARIRAAGREICAKYVHPPHSTDFGVLFLPTEGLFAEVVRRPGLIDALQNECRIVVTGPTTLMALLSSLRMGFRTLAIQKRSSEVWRVLAAVKSEFEKFGDVMDKVSKKLQEAQSAVDQAGTRRRAVDRKLRGVEAMPAELAALKLFEAGDGDRDLDDTVERDSKPN